MKNFFLTCLFFISFFSVYSQGDLYVANGSSRIVRFQISTVAVAGDCNVQLASIGTETLNPSTINIYNTYTNFSFNTWKKTQQTPLSNSTITSFQANLSYGTPNWEYLKCDIYDGSTIIYSFGIGANNCMGNSQSYNNGTFSATWNQVGNDIYISFLGS